MAKKDQEIKPEKWAVEDPNAALEVALAEAKAAKEAAEAAQAEAAKLKVELEATKNATSVSPSFSSNTNKPAAPAKSPEKTYIPPPDGAAKRGCYRLPSGITATNA